MFLEKILPAKLKFRPKPVDFPAILISIKTLKKFSSSLLQTIRTQPLYSQPCPQNIPLDYVTYTKLVQFSTRTGSLIHGKLAHAHMIKASFKPCLFLLNNLLCMYCKCGEVDVAYQVFDLMPKRNVVTYNLLISGYAQLGLYGNAMDVFEKARMDGIKLDRFTYGGALGVSGQSRNLELGRLIHGLIIVNGLNAQVFVINALIDMYCKCGRVDQARYLFESSDELNDVSWNSLITGYVRIGRDEDMWELLVGMHRSGLKLNTYALGSVLKACSVSAEAMTVHGKMIHGCTVKLGLDLDIVIGTALLDMYAKAGSLLAAIQIFKLMPNPNIVMYNAMISGFVQTEFITADSAKAAFNLYSEMQKRGMRPSKFTFSIILTACNSVEAYECGKQIHAQIYKNSLQSDEFIGSALIELYSSLDSTEDAAKCFDSTSKLDVVSWTSMITCLVQNGKFESALALFYNLLASGKKPDEFIISSIVGACADLATARSGEQVQGYALKSGFGNFTVVQNSQIFMYSKSGEIDSANMTFKETYNPDVVSWSAMICSNAHHGCARDALDFFECMKGCGIVPNQITFLGILTACSHGGLVEEGLRYFKSMKNDYGVTPNVKHCACIVDLLGRAGRIADAENFILNSGFENDPVMWRALLSACRIYSDMVTGKRAAGRVIELEPQAAASYVLLYNIYTDAGIELPATEVRDLMKDRGVKKEPGLSWIEVGSKVHSFVVGDRSHPLSPLIYAKLEEMLEKITTAGYIDERFVSITSGSETKGISVVNHHSEKLAVTFGIISLPALAPVKVMKNLRVCRDCHMTMKLFSKVEQRKIVLRDPIRFHHFQDGSCSCGDFW